jgi:inosose dehydratase
MTARAGARLAAAPISWGVCEVPGWGFQLPADRVLREMRELGLRATEFGPAGFLPSRPADRLAVLRRHGLAAAGGFVPVVLHDRAADPVPQIDQALDSFGEARDAVLVLAATTGGDGYDTRPELSTDGWRTLLANLDRCRARAARRGFRAVLHPHVGTFVERQADIDRVLSGCSIPLCLDTGHLLIGGVDPAELASRYPGRIAHAHLKDVDSRWASRVMSGEVTYADAVAAGMYRPLGQGDVDLACVISSLEKACYQGWYVLEQDSVLTGPPGDEGPAAEVRTSLAFLADLL